MVQLANFDRFRPQSEKAVVKLEIEDALEEEHGPLNKKPKWGEDGGMLSSQPAQCSLLDEPSPLGLRLRKSPSLLDLIQMRLSQGNSITPSNGGFETGKKELKSTAISGATDKLKASNFPASLLRIGSWECVSRYEGDLVAKCYYAKHKLVWEVLDGGLKSKIEIQWSDITALQAACPENAPGTLDIVMARQPLFFAETNPQPRKHTLWQATSDFTNGQASIHRRHFLQCPPGLLSKHFEKLIQCDPRLNSLSRQPGIILESPYFEPRSSVFEDHDESKFHGFDDQKDGFASTMSGFRDNVPACAAPLIYAKNETRVPIGRLPDNMPRETLSPSSVFDARAIEENPTTSGTKVLSNDPKPWDQIKVPGLRSSMSMSDLVNHIGHCISGQTTPGNPLIPTDSSLNKSAFEELTQYLLCDSQVNSASDEESLMSRVNSLCCLIQHKKPMADDDHEDDDDASDDDGQEAEMKPSISRKESYGELLMHLPRIASMPFLFNISEDSENHAV